MFASSYSTIAMSTIKKKYQESTKSNFRGQLKTETLHIFEDMKIFKTDGPVDGKISR